MNATRFFAFAAAASLLAGAAAAQPYHDPSTPIDRPAHMTPGTSYEDSQARSAAEAGVNTGAVIRYSPTPIGEAWRLRAGDPYVVTNGPVPDTQQNRARFGGPMSRTGRMTAPVGN
jgi:hypothetical protein